MYIHEERKFKDDLKALTRQKLSGLSVFPTNITPSLKERIKNLQEEFLILRQTKKFTKEKGIEMLEEIDSINEELKSLPIKQDDDETEYRKRKLKKPISKRKPVKKVIKRKK